MKIDINLITITFLIFTSTAYSKGTPLESTIFSKQDFLKIPNKSIDLKSINLIKPVSIALEGNIDFRKFFSKKN